MVRERMWIAKETRFASREVGASMARKKLVNRDPVMEIVKTPDEHEFLVAEIPARFLDQEIRLVQNELVEHFDRLGFRFVDKLEADEFLHVYPDLLGKKWLLSLGSLGDVLLFSDPLDVVRAQLFGYGLGEGCHLLLVPKVPSGP